MSFTACDIEENGAVVDEKAPYKMERTVPASAIIIGGGMFCPSASLVVKTEYLHTLPEYYFQADVSDYPLQIYMAICGKVHYLPDHTCVYRRAHAGSWSATVRASWERELAHYKTEVAWLNAVDTATNGRYKAALTIRKLKYRLVLLRSWYRLKRASG